MANIPNVREGSVYVYDEKLDKYVFIGTVYISSYVINFDDPTNCNSTSIEFDYTYYPYKGVLFDPIKADYIIQYNSSDKASRYLDISKSGNVEDSLDKWACKKCGSELSKYCKYCPSCGQNIGT